jgi:translation initiation factor 1
MAKKKSLNSLSDLGGMVYSTGAAPAWADTNRNEKKRSPGEQNLEAHLEKKGRGGKVAVLVKGFKGSEDELKSLAKELKNHCATGGSVKEGEIIIQGNLREKITQYLNDKGFQVKRVVG